MLQISNTASNDFAASHALDDHGILRISHSRVIIEQSFEYGIPRNFETVTSGGGSVTMGTLFRNVVLSVGTANGDRAMIQSKAKVRWRWGHSMCFTLTGVPNHGNTVLTGGTKIRFGYFDDNDGEFLEISATGVFLVFRTSTSGATVDIKIPQSTWAFDKLDGTGGSGYSVNWSKVQRIWISASSPGGGRGRFGLWIRDKQVQAHQISSLNSRDDVPFLRTVLLSHRVELVNDGAGSGAKSQLYSISGVEEGPFPTEETGYIMSCGNGEIGKVLSTTEYKPILSVRLVDTKENYKMRGHILPLKVSILNVGNNPVHWHFLENATVTNQSFSPCDATNSITEISTSGSSVSGGINTGISGYVSAGQGSSSSLIESSEYPNKSILSRNYSDVRDTLTLSAIAIGGATTLHAELTLREVF